MVGDYRLYAKLRYLVVMGNYVNENENFVREANWTV